MFVTIFFACILFFQSTASAMESYADLIEDMMPSVVNISTQRDVTSAESGVENLMIEKDLVGRESLGTGFFISEDGYILTNYHIIKKAKRISIITNDEKKYTALVVGIDEPSDLAVLRIKTEKNSKTKFKPVIFGNADTSRIGDIILTLGNPYGLGISASQGIISAKSRQIGLGEQQYIQTDASINEGNSGGPMFNLQGEVIGINSAIFTEKGASGVGFALPSNIANWVAMQLINGGKVRRGWLGISVAYGVDTYTNKSGFVITEIDETSNAYKEGLRIGDIILDYNGNKATSLNDFNMFTETVDPGQILKLKTITMGEEIKYTIKIQEMPSSALQNITNKALEEQYKHILEDMDKDVVYISEFGIAVKESSPRGLMIMKIDRLSPLIGKGIQKGDVILEANREDIYSAENLLDSIHHSIFEDIRSVSLLIQGPENTFYADIEVGGEND